MPNVSQIFAVRPTHTVDQVSFDRVWHSADGGGLADGYTNATSVRLGDGLFLCAYNKTTGGADLYTLAGAAPWIKLVDSRIDLHAGEVAAFKHGFWENLSSFVLGGDSYLLTYRPNDGTFGFFRLSQDRSASPPYTFSMPRNTPTPNFTTVAPFTSLGAQYVLGYNFNDGTVAAYSVSVITSAADGVPPLNALNVWYHHWAKNWTRFAFFQLGGSNFFFKINTGKLNVNIDHLQDNPALGTVEVGSRLDQQLPDALSIDIAAVVPWSHGDPRLLTYIASSGVTAFYRIHGDCLGWTKLAANTDTTVAGAIMVIPYHVGDDSYALFYGGGQ